MSDESVGVYVGEVSGKEYAVIKKDFQLYQDKERTDVNLGPYLTECGLQLSEHNDGRFFCHDLGEFLIKK